jgi:hypothetical protein
LLLPHLAKPNKWIFWLPCASSMLVGMGL